MKTKYGATISKKKVYENEPMFLEFGDDDDGDLQKQNTINPNKSQCEQYSNLLIISKYLKLKFSKDELKGVSQPVYIIMYCCQKPFNYASENL